MFGKSRKLSSRFVESFGILKKEGEVAYLLAPPPNLIAAHDVFHILMLKKYILDPCQKIDYKDWKSRMIYHTLRN